MTSPGASVPRARNNIELVAVAGIVLLAIAVRAWQMGYSFDSDEVFSIELATSSFGDMIAGALHDTPHPPLHIVLLHFWSFVFGPSEVAARSLSVFLSAGFMIFSWLLLRRWLRPDFALGILALIALSPLFITYGQQARPYALIAFLSALNLWLFLRFIDESGTRRDGLLWAASCAALLYAHYMGILFVGISGLYGLVVAPPKRRAIVVLGTVGCATIIPWAFAAMWKPLSSFTDPLPQIGWIAAPTPEEFAWFFSSIVDDTPLLRERWLLLAFAIVIGWYLVRAIRRKQLPAEQRLLLALGIGMPVIVYLLSIVGVKPIFASRQLLGAGMVFIGLVGVCVQALSRAAGYLSLAALLAWAALGLPEALPSNTKPPWREISQYASEHYPSRPTVVNEWWVRVPYGHYRNPAAVEEFRNFAAQAPAAEILLLCRPPHCAAMLDSAALEGRSTFVKKWTWKGGDVELHELSAR